MACAGEIWGWVWDVVNENENIKIFYFFWLKVNGKKNQPSRLSLMYSLKGGFNDFGRMFMVKKYNSRV